MGKSKLIVVSGFINELIIQRTTVATKRRKKTKRRKSRKQKKEQSRDRFAKKNFPAGNYRPRRADRWEDIPTEVGET